MIYYQLYLEKNKGLYTYMDEKEEYHIGESVFVSFRNRKHILLQHPQKKKTGSLYYRERQSERIFF